MNFRAAYPTLIPGGINVQLVPRASFYCCDVMLILELFPRVLFYIFLCMICNNLLLLPQMTYLFSLLVQHSKTCPDPGQPRNGMRKGDDFTEDSTVLFECNPDYKIIGDAQIKCQSNGKWTERTPFCTGNSPKLYYPLQNLKHLV